MSVSEGSFSEHRLVVEADCLKCWSSSLQVLPILDTKERHFLLDLVSLIVAVLGSGHTRFFNGDLIAIGLSKSLSSFIHSSNF
jgi:hypothetical protein